ncbi:hypothetical protein JTE90_015559 [Oedothorax gibbosus]|uniref:Endonuclease/exonuclease/phosphatase domain-containing protein n=1 Tax=Oedothorax gibbosus TaxID=931172 RepID=A0AAV6UKB4_9ARAC|nr:hypothetical protein JTE90_015559 [Oedothorax gibbosus]
MRKVSGKCSFKGKGNPSLKILFWNAGGLTQDKFTELKQISYTESPDVIGIVESGASDDNLKYFPFKNYTTFSLQRSRQIVSGIVIFVKNNLIAKPYIKHVMSDSDTLEAFEIRVWKQNMGHRITFVYNPPRNKPDLDCLIQDWNKRSIILGDFNAYSTRWGYRQSCVIGKLMEDFIDSGEIDFIENE